MIFVQPICDVCVVVVTCQSKCASPPRLKHDLACPPYILDAQKCTLNAQKTFPLSQYYAHDTNNLKQKSWNTGSVITTVVTVKTETGKYQNPNNGDDTRHMIEGIKQCQVVNNPTDIALNEATLNVAVNVATSKFKCSYIKIQM